MRVAQYPRCHLKFAILYNVEYHPEIHGTPADYYAQILDQIELQEELGFDAVWFGEHHYSGYSFGSPPVIAMAAAARTKRIRLGTGVSLIPLNQPIRLAEEYAMLDVLSGGRLEYGVGRGFLKYLHDVLGANTDESHERYREGIEIILKAWTADRPFSYKGKFTELEDYTFFPKPIQQPHPPIYAAGASTPESFTWAGKYGFHLCTAFFFSEPETIRDNVALYRRSLIENGHDPATKDIAGVCQMYCGESDEEAHRIGGPHVMNYYAFFAGLDQRSPHTSDAFASYRRSLTERKDEIKYEDLDRKNLLMIGSSETLIRRIRQLQDYYGTNYLLFEVAQGGMDPKNVVSSLERFAVEVMPAFRSDDPVPTI